MHGALVGRLTIIIMMTVRPVAIDVASFAIVVECCHGGRRELIPLLISSEGSALIKGTLQA